MNKEMQPGEKTLRKVFEDTTTNNVLAVAEHSNETRRQVKRLEARLDQVEGINRNQAELITALKLQLSTVQTAVFRGGT